MQAYKGLEIQLHALLILALDWGQRAAVSDQLHA
jgi:hypothetical protein